MKGDTIPLKLNLLISCSYNQRDLDLTAFTIGYRRSTSVTIGVLWAGIISNYWWPFAARTELRTQLSE